jgi:hypothetical protein
MALKLPSRGVVTRFTSPKLPPNPLAQESKGERPTAYAPTIGRGATSLKQQDLGPYGFKNPPLQARLK